MPLNQSLSFIRERVKTILEEAGFVGEGGKSLSEEHVKLDVPDKDNLSEGVYIGLLYTEEEKTLRNSTYLQTYYKKDDPSAIEGYHKVNPKLYLNLYVLILSVSDTYTEALKHISCVISAFQKKSVFVKLQKTEYDEEKQEEVVVTVQNDFGNKYASLEKMVFEINTLTFEQNNSLWQTLGGKIYPYIIYKVKMVAFAEAKAAADMKPIDKRIGLVKPVASAAPRTDEGAEVMKADKESVENQKKRIEVYSEMEKNGLVFVESEKEYQLLKKKMEEEKENGK